MASEVTIPHAVVSLMVEHDMSPVRAWREHLQLTPGDIAAKLSMTPSAYEQLKSASEVRADLLGAVADALGISVEQLDL